MIDPGLLDILACPATRRGLHPLAADKLERLNELIAERRATYVDGDLVDTAVSAGLITDNGTIIYRIDDDIPVLLVERGIPARQLEPD